MANGKRIEGTDHTPLDQVCLARLPVAALASLAKVRCAPGVTVTVVGDQAWLRWSPGQDEVLRPILAIPGVELFEQRDDVWYRHGCRLPAFGVPPAGEALTLHRLLTPAVLTPVELAAWERRPVRLRLVPEERPRPTTALRCHIGALILWMDTATTAEIEALRAVRWNYEALVRGPNLPAIRESERFWGDRLLIPLGRRPDPALPESALCVGLNIGEHEIAMLFDDGIDVVPLKLFQPLTRAAARVGLMGFA